MQKDRTTRVLVDLTSIPSFEFNYQTKCMALAQLVPNMAVTLNLQVESKLALATLKELKGAHKQYADPGQFCVEIFADHCQAKGTHQTPFWLKPVDAYFFLSTCLQATAKAFFDEYFGDAAQVIEKALLDSRDALDALMKSHNEATVATAYRLANLGTIDFSWETKHPYWHYAETLLSHRGQSVLKAFDQNEEKAIQGLLSSQDHPLADVFYVDRDHAELFTLAWKNFKESALCLDDLNMPVFKIVENLREMIPGLKKEWVSHKRGSFVRLIYRALDEKDRFDLKRLEFDKGFCSLLALAVEDVFAYPDEFQIEYFRMCHYAGFGFETDLYDFSQDCDYATRHYEDLSTLAEDDEGIESSIVIEEHPFVQYEVSYEFDNEEALAHMPLTREALGHINLRELVDCLDSEEVDTFAEAKERAMAIERDRRDQLVSISNGRRALLNELIHRGPKVTIKPVVTEDSDF